MASRFLKGFLSFAFAQGELRQIGESTGMVLGFSYAQAVKNRSNNPDSFDTTVQTIFWTGIGWVIGPLVIAPASVDYYTFRETKKGVGNE